MAMQCWTCRYAVFEKRYIHRFHHLSNAKLDRRARMQSHRGFQKGGKFGQFIFWDQIDVTLWKTALGNGGVRQVFAITCATVAWMKYRGVSHRFWFSGRVSFQLNKCEETWVGRAAYTIVTRSSLSDKEAYHTFSEKKKFCHCWRNIITR